MDLPVYTGDVKRRNKCIAPWWAVRIVSSDPTNTPGLRWCLFPSDLLQGVWRLIWTWFSANSAGFLFRWTKLLRADKEQRRPDTEATQNIRLTVKIRETAWRIIQNSPRDRPRVIQYIQPSHSSGRDTKQPTKEVVALSSCVITLTQCLSLVFPAHPHDTFGCVETGASSPTTWSCRVHLWTLWCSNKVFVKGNLWLAQRSQVQLTDTVTMSKCSIYVFWTWQLGLCSRISCSIAGWKQFVFRLKNYTSCSNVCTPPGDGEEEPQPRLAGVGTVTSRKEGQRAGGHPETPTQQGGRGRLRR